MDPLRLRRDLLHSFLVSADAMPREEKFGVIVIPLRY